MAARGRPKAGTWPWEPFVAISLFASFAIGWVLTGFAAVRADRPSFASSGGAA